MSDKKIKMPKRFDYSCSAEFNRQVQDLMAPGESLTLDCSGMDYIDSAGIGLLVMAYKKVQSVNAKLEMISLKTDPREILQLANLQKIIDIK